MRPFDQRIARLTVDQVHAMLEAGILHDGEPIELIDGVLVRKDRGEQGEDQSRIGKKHNLVVHLLMRLDRELTAFGCHMQSQGPICVPPRDREGRRRRRQRSRGSTAKATAIARADGEGDSDREGCRCRDRPSL